MRRIHFTVHFQRTNGDTGYADMVSRELPVAGGMALTPAHVEILRQEAMENLTDCQSVVILGWHVLASEAWPRPI